MRPFNCQMWWILPLLVGTAKYGLCEFNIQASTNVYTNVHVILYKTAQWCSEMPSRLDWSPVKVGNWYLRGSISSPVGNCTEYVVAPVKDTLSNQMQVSCAKCCTGIAEPDPIQPCKPSQFFLTSTIANTKSPPYSNPALTMIKSGSSVETLPAFLDWTALQVFFVRGLTPLA